MKLNDLKREIQAVLKEDNGALAQAAYMTGNGRYDGYAYVACEAMLHLAGGRDSGLQPMQLRHNGVSHWWLRDQAGKVIDLTLARGERSEVPYEEGSARPFRYTPNGISLRALTIVERVQAARDR